MNILAPLGGITAVRAQCPRDRPRPAAVRPGPLQVSYLAALRPLQTAYLVACRNADGGFSGREGDSDLNYTACGLARNAQSVCFRKCGGIGSPPWDNGVFSRETSARPERSHCGQTPPSPSDYLKDGDRCQRRMPTTRCGPRTPKQPGRRPARRPEARKGFLPHRTTGTSLRCRPPHPWISLSPCRRPVFRAAVK